MTSEFITYWSKRLKFVDVHYHASPDSYLRRYTAYEAGLRYDSVKGAVVIKNHLGSVTALSTTLQKLNLPVFGSIVLNQFVGLDLDVVKQALSQYQFHMMPRLLVHLPTIVPTKHKSLLKRSFSNIYSQELSQNQISITDDSGKLLPEIIKLIYFAQENNILLSSGHSSKKQTMMLIEAVEKIGGCRLMLNQPANPSTGFSASDLIALGSHDWLFIEQCALTVYLKYQTESDMYDVLSNVNNVVYSSDLGQPDKPDINEWLGDSKMWFKDAGLPINRIQEITLINPLKMLEPDPLSNLVSK